MEWPKLKNIMLIILLLVNLFLLVLLCYREGRSAQYFERTRENAIEILARNGIAVEENVLPQDASLAPLSMERDKTAEAEAAAALLGPVTESGQGGASVYTGEKGTARFSRTGAFSATLWENAYPLTAGQTVQENALSVLAQMEIDAVVLSAETDGNKTVVTARQLWNGTPVFSCGITLVYENQTLVSIREGKSTRLTGTPVRTDTEESQSAVTALMRFLEGINDLGDVCTELTGMTAGYVFTAGVSDPITLKPIWYITTDTGSYYLNAGDGALERAQ